MRDKRLIKIAKEFYLEGVKDEDFIMKAIETTLGRNLQKKQ